MKKKILATLLLSSLFISACSSSEESAEPAQPVELETGGKIDHVHGLFYSQDNSIYLGTHEGMISSKDQGKTWSTVSSYDYDFMGFHALSNGDLITSGHPGPKSDLLNPLGFVKSTDYGEKWDSISLLGKIDFHIMTSNYNNPDLIYGLNQMGEGEYGAGLYVSSDGGENWDKIEPNGLPEDLHKVYSMIALPNDKNVMLAGTEQGVMRSEDGGKTWSLLDGSRYISNFAILPNEDKDLISYSVTEKEAGMMISKDSGRTWEKLGLDLGEDAVNFISVNSSNANQIIASSYKNSLYISEDGGVNWEKIIDEGSIQ